MAHTLSDWQRARQDREELDFTVEAWTRDAHAIDQVLSRNGNMLVARAAFEQACLQYPNVYLRLRHGCRLIEERKGTP
ncbi:hypothetical protein [Microvirga antarctica]|uniref:hypothetical protein n=1 Tax=Microvirga antarctica TaxID=2819233 RepID=UPI001B3178D0|nr:hypothetical protein [Microvirga antarctica]